jgi:hypothetical protein
LERSFSKDCSEGDDVRNICTSLFILFLFLFFMLVFFCLLVYFSLSLLLPLCCLLPPVSSFSSPPFSLFFLLYFSPTYPCLPLISSSFLSSFMFSFVFTSLHFLFRPLPHLSSFSSPLLPFLCFFFFIFLLFILVSL